ncbi:MAG: hypothetical protein A2687_00535 [Candidatus Levybacteria bacterium RIFCSPHIGHO2_01_FULL_38_26]|nr:MAG: hypothetical protein A2687_00535 [Candidatus Levybacteria bacterium RIFCSPHIGHO2_01_FULL_38_26]
MIFAFLAGIVTILSPCILPILPIILSSSLGGVNIGRLRPLGVVFGFVASFTFFTLFLSTIVRISGIPVDTLRFLAVIVIAGFGVSFLVPRFQVLLERLFSKLSSFAPTRPAGTGFGSGFIIGLSLGLLWTPCVGPILASVISLAIVGTVTLDAFLIILAYSIGTAIPMFMIIIGGQNLFRKVPWLLVNSANIQKAFGIIMIATALGILFNIDRKFQTFILDRFPQYGVGLTQFEDNDLIRGLLEDMGSEKMQKEDMGKPMFNLLQPKGTRAPEIIPGGSWFNSDPLTVKSLRGKVVIVDFWTYSCINCQRTFPYLRQWWEKYKDKGLVILGVHSPEFEFEKNQDNVRKAISDFALEYPIVQDNNFATWRAYSNRYWPAKYFIDKDGYIRYSHFGEGAYDESEKVIQELLMEAGAEDVSGDVNNPLYQVYSKTPETYLGYGRISNFASSEKILPNKTYVYTKPPTLPDNNVAFEGEWLIMEEYASPQKGAKLFLNFEAKEIYLVMRTSADQSKVRVFIDDKMQYFGEDNENGIVTVDGDRLYKLINLSSPEKHLLRLEFDDSNSQLFAFTFG